MISAVRLNQYLTEKGSPAVGWVMPTGDAVGRVGSFATMHELALAARTAPGAQPECNEFSDHGPELRTGVPRAHMDGTSRIRRGARVLRERPFVTGESNMCHSLANLEYHHFEYAAHRRPGDVHLHFFGTSTISFADGIAAEAGDVFEVDLPALGAPLSNPLALRDDGYGLHGVRTL